MNAAALGGGARRRALAILVVVSAAMAVLHPVDVDAESAPFPGAVNVVPMATPKVGQCIPFGNNSDFGFSGFIYKNVPAFTLKPGTKFAFDLGSLNDVDVRRNIYFSAADHNPAPPLNGNVRALAWTKVVSDTQTPDSPRGNTTVGDYELVYTSERDFVFGGGGFIIGFGSSASGSYGDGGCEQVGVTTSGTDPSGLFYARFWNKPNLEMGFLDKLSWGTTFLSGFVVFQDTTPPVVTASVSPSPAPDGWVDPADGPVSVTWTGTDEMSGIDSCDDAVPLPAPGIYSLTGSCTDGAGNVGSASVVVRVARRVAIDVTPATLTPRRRGAAWVVVKSSGDFDALTIDHSSVRMGVTGAEESVATCGPSSGDLLCRFDTATSGVSPTMILKGFADGIRVIGSTDVRVVGS